jgi:hypothetical protein
MINYITPQLAPTPPPFWQIVLLAVVLTALVVCLDTAPACLNRLYQRYRQGRWDARKARRQSMNRAIHTARGGFPVRDYQDHQPGEWVPRREWALFRLRCAGRGVRVSGGKR